MLDILSQVDTWLQQWQQVALATVVDTWGSAPRRVGSKMAVTQDMAMVGSVSGGCVEGAVVEEALKSLKRHRPHLLNYGISDDTAWEVGLACGGKISILVEPLDVRWWQLAADAAQHDKHLTTLTILEGEEAGARIAFDAGGEVVYASDLTPERLQSFTGILLPAASGRATVASSAVMVDVIESRPHLVLVGGVHVAMSLQYFAKALGFRVTLIDPREAFATDERFPDVDCIARAYPDKALDQIGIDSNTYFAILAHDPKIDDPALKAALKANPAYIGILSSRRTHEKRVERLTGAGISASDIARLKTPIGLDIGAATPEEIALAIMAEIVAIRRQAVG